MRGVAFRLCPFGAAWRDTAAPQPVHKPRAYGVCIGRHSRRLNQTPPSSVTKQTEITTLLPRAFQGRRRRCHDCNAQCSGFDAGFGHLMLGSACTVFGKGPYSPFELNHYACVEASRTNRFDCAFLNATTPSIWATMEPTIPWTPRSFPWGPWSGPFTQPASTTTGASRTSPLKVT